MRIGNPPGYGSVGGNDTGFGCKIQGPPDGFAVPPVHPVMMGADWGGGDYTAFHPDTQLPEPVLARFRQELRARMIRTDEAALALMRELLSQYVLELLESASTIDIQDVMEES